MSDDKQRELRGAILGLAGSMAAASDQADSMTDAELGEVLLSGRWTIIEVHEAGRRLARPKAASSSAAVTGEDPS